MAYNSAKTYGKPANKTTEAPKAEAPAAEGKRMPVGNLYIQADGAEKKTKLTGLFKEVSKAGQTYYRGKDDQGNKFIVFLD